MSDAGRTEPALWVRRKQGDYICWVSDTPNGGSIVIGAIGIRKIHQKYITIHVHCDVF